MEIVIPLLIVLLFAYALIKKVNPYDAFVEGAVDALPTIIKVLPYLCAMLMAINVFRSSGVMDILSIGLSPVLNKIGVPTEIAALIVLRPFSGTAALALLKDVLAQFGADSFVGRAASIIVGSTETVFYTIALYCGSVGIKKTRHALPVALLSGFVGVICALFVAKIM